MDKDIIIRFIILIIFFIIAVYLLTYVITSNNEHFDATGWVYNKRPNWFNVKKYNPEDWLVNVYPEHIQPECLPYSIESKYGSLDNLNYYSQAYRFWRF